MSAIDSLIKIKFFWNLFEIGFSNLDSVSHRPISELKRLKFAQPADLPVQQAVMVTNLKTAKALRGPGGGCAQHHGWCCFWRYMKARRVARAASRPSCLPRMRRGGSRRTRPSCRS